MITELAVVGVIVLLVAPSFGLLFRLAQRGYLSEQESGASFLAGLQSEGTSSPLGGREDQPASEDT